jgi:uncharacterized protein YneF (UPF0154 family)
VVVAVVVVVVVVVVVLSLIGDLIWVARKMLGSQMCPYQPPALALSLSNMTSTWFNTNPQKMSKRNTSFNSKINTSQPKVTQHRPNTIPK